MTDAEHLHKVLSRRFNEMIANPGQETANALFDAAASIWQTTFAQDRKLSGRAESMMWTAIKLGANR